jgi:acetyl-CoA acyltransferase 1
MYKTKIIHLQSSAVRTAVTKAKKGGFKDTHPTELLAAVLKGVTERGKVQPKQVQDIAVGWVLAPGGVRSHRVRYKKSN